jgi:chloride channel protein, CIC family
LRAGLPLLGRASVVDAMSAPKLVLRSDLTVGEALEQMQSASVAGAPVVDAQSRFIGSAYRDQLLDEPTTVAVAKRVEAGAPTVADDAKLDEALDALHGAHRWLTVLDAKREVRGIVGVREIVHAYRIAAEADVHRFSRISAHADLVDVRVESGSTLIGKALGENVLPNDVIVVSITRGDSVLAGTAGINFERDDVVTLLGEPAELDSVKALLTPAL